MQLQFKGEEGVGSAKDLITIALLPPSSLPLSIYIYHQLANCSNLPSTVKMKTSRVRVHRNSVYYRNSRITSWRANEQSIVPPTPETRCPKNFASTGSAARKQVLRIGTVKRCSIRERFIFPPLARTRNFTSPEAEAFNQLGRGGETEFSGALKGRSRG